MTEDDYREQHKQRLAYMPWLYARLKPKHRAWAEPWQQALQQRWMALETVTFGTDCFVAPQAVLLAEPGRDIIVGDGSQIAADCVIHGPVRLGRNVSLNHHVTLEGGAAGVISVMAPVLPPLHLMPSTTVCMQAVRCASSRSSKGIHIGKDVWVGARSIDGDLGDHAVVGMGPWLLRMFPRTIVAGNPARPIGRGQVCLNTLDIAGNILIVEHV